MVVLGVGVVHQKVAEGRKDLPKALGFISFQNCLHSDNFAGEREHSDGGLFCFQNRGYGGGQRSNLLVNVGGGCAGDRGGGGALRSSLRVNVSWVSSVIDVRWRPVLSARADRETKKLCRWDLGIH